MNAPPILQRHPALRWLAPIGIACIAGLAATGVLQGKASSSSRSLPETTPAALIAAVQKPQVQGFAGDVVTHLSLGLPELPVGAGTSDTSFASLLSGAHSMRVWYGGLTRQRIALLGATDETDVFRDGTELWQWSSADHSAVHAVLPADGSSDGLAAAVADLTPLDLAQRLLEAVEPTTRVTVVRDQEVADRPAYDLVLEPRSTQTKVGQVRISVDGRTKVPLAVQVTARGAGTPAVDVSFTKITYGQQADRSFRFTPPADARVRELRGTGRSPVAIAGQPAPRRVSTTGSGWTTVLALEPSTHAMASLTKGALSALTPVRGSWGRGYLLDSDLVSALLTSDGRVLVGAVPPQALYAAAARK